MDASTSISLLGNPYVSKAHNPGVAWAISIHCITKVAKDLSQLIYVPILLHACFFLMVKIIWFDCEIAPH